MTRTGATASSARARPVDPRLLRHSRSSRPFLLVCVLLGLLNAATVLGQAVLLARVITAVFLGGADLSAVGADLALLAGIVGLRALLAYAQETAATRASATVKSQLRTALVRRAVALGPGWLERRHCGEVTQQATRGVDAVDAYFARYLPQLVLTCLVPPMFVVVIWATDWLSGLIVLLTLPVVVVFLVLIGQATERQSRRQWRSLERLAHHFLDVVDGLTTLRVFGRAAAQQRAISAVTDEYRRTTMGVLRVSFLSSFVLELAASLSVALVAVQIGLRLLGGDLGLGVGLLILLLAPDVYLPLRRLGADHHAAQEGRAATGQHGGAGPSGQRDGQPCDGSGQPQRAPGVPQRQLRNLLTERALRTLGVLADQAPHVQLDHYAPSGHRKIGQAPHVPGMHPA